MTIHAIQYAQSTLPESMVLSGGSEEIRLDISFVLYLVEIGSRKILIDAGCDSLPGFVLTNFKPPAQALADYGISHHEITDVIITHAHYDHIDGLRHFPQARIHIQKEEYRNGMAFIPIYARVYTFQDRSIVANRLQIKRIGGHTAGSCIVQAKVGDTTFIFGGDECYLPICLQQQIPTGASHNPQASSKFVKHFRKPGYRVLLTHDTQIQTGIIISERI